MIKYTTFELTFSGDEPAGSHAQVDLEAVFTCGENQTKVKGFYAGNGTYKVRFMPQEEGLYTWEVKGVLQAEGREICQTDPGCRGMVQAEGTHFVYQNGDRYIPFGTTIYALTLQPETLIAQTMDSLGKAPFNKVRHCIFPKHYDYNHNEPDYYPFEKDGQGKWDVHHPCFAYWDHFEYYVKKLADMGIETDLILFHPYDRWGFSTMTMEENKVYLDYALRRLSAIPGIWWSLANEYDLFFNRKMEDWYEIEAYVAQEDPYHHLLSNHNCFSFYDFSRENVTHCCVQTMAMHRGQEWMRQFGKPVIYDECCYEGNIQHEWGNISGWEMANRFWKACTYGAFATHGETFFSEDEVLWWARGGILKGQSPERIAYLKELMYSLEGPLEPWDDRLAPEDDENAIANLNYFQNLIDGMNERDGEDLAWKGANYCGHYKDRVFMKYFAHQCIAVTDLNLPKEHTYKIEVIDMWEMTRTVLMERAGGVTRLRLPGREGIAVLATMVD